MPDLPVAENRIVGRRTGEDLDDLTPEQVLEMLAPTFSWTDSAPAPTETGHDSAAVGGILRESVVSGTVTRAGGAISLGDPDEPDAEHSIAGGATLLGGDLAMASGAPPAGFVYFYSGETLMRAGGTTIANGAEIAGLYLYSGVTRILGGDVTISGTPVGTPATVGGGTILLAGGDVAALGVPLADLGNAQAGNVFIQGGFVQGSDSDANPAQLRVYGAHNDVAGDVTLTAGTIASGGGTPGSVIVIAGDGTTKILDTNHGNTLATFNGVGVPITSVAVNLAQVHAALVTLGLITT